MRFHLDHSRARGSGCHDGCCAIDQITDVELACLTSIMGAVADDAELSPLARRFADVFFDACECLSVQVADRVAKPSVHLRVQGTQVPDVVALLLDENP